MTQTALRALVVEDEETSIEQVTQVLRTLGFAVDVVRDGLDALARCQSMRYDLIVCDVRMPRLSGLSVLSNISGTRNAATRVVMISALDDDSIRRQALASGAAAYLVKPVTTEMLEVALAPGDSAEPSR